MFESLGAVKSSFTVFGGEPLEESDQSGVKLGANQFCWIDFKRILKQDSNFILLSKNGQEGNIIMNRSTGGGWYYLGHLVSLHSTQYKF